MNINNYYLNKYYILYIMNFQGIILSVLLLSLLGNIFMNNKSIISPSHEISYSNMNTLNNITKIEVISKKALIYTDDLKHNETVPEFYYIIGNDDIFNEYIIKHNDTDIFYKEITETNISKFFSILPKLLFIYILIRIFIQSRQLGDFDKRLALTKDIKIKFKDIAGLKEVKEEVKEFVDLLNGAEKFKEIGCKVPRGGLFYGQPGTGKTLIAKAVAGECKSNFIHVSGSGFNELYVGVGQSRVRQLFENARNNKPCVIFIDEIDALGAKRSNNSGHSEHENTLNSLLSEMDGIDNNDGILVFGATNRPELLDPALMRPGRFDRKIQFNLPTIQEREEMFVLYLEKYKIDGDKFELAKYISKKGYGLSGADISNLCNEAAIIVVRNDRKQITKNDLDDAFDYVAVGKKRLSNKLNVRDKKCVSYHECGHAFMSYIQKHTESPIKISIIPTTKGALGYSMSVDKEENLKTSRQLYQQMAVMLGGRCSESIFMDDITTGASNDLMRLREMCKKYIMEYGFTDEFRNNYISENIENVSENTKYSIDQKIQSLINEVTDYTTKTLTENKKIIKGMSSVLYKKEELNQSDIKKILGIKIESTLN